MTFGKEEYSVDLTQTWLPTEQLEPDEEGQELVSGTSWFQAFSKNIWMLAQVFWPLFPLRMTALVKCAALPMDHRCTCERMLRQRRQKTERRFCPECVSSCMTQRRSRYPEPAVHGHCSQSQFGAQKTDAAPRRDDQAAASESGLAPEIKLLSYILNSSINYPSEPRGISLIHKISDTSNL